MLKTTEQQGPDVIKSPCPVYLFVRWKPGVRKYGETTSNYNGDKWVTDGDLGKMIIALVKILEKKYHAIDLAYLYDNRIPKYDPERGILKINKGIIEINRLKCFEPIMHDYPLPDFLK